MKKKIWPWDFKSDDVEFSRIHSREARAERS